MPLSKLYATLFNALFPKVDAGEPGFVRPGVPRAYLLICCTYISVALIAAAAWPSAGLADSWQWGLFLVVDGALVFVGVDWLVAALPSATPTDRVFSSATVRQLRLAMIFSIPLVIGAVYLLLSIGVALGTALLNEMSGSGFGGLSPANCNEDLDALGANCLRFRLMIALLLHFYFVKAEPSSTFSFDYGAGIGSVLIYLLLVSVRTALVVLALPLLLKAFERSFSGK